MSGSPIHIITTLQEVRGNDIHAVELLRSLQADGQSASLWSDRPGAFVARCGGRVINPYGGQMPRGGTLILLGSWLTVDPWIDFSKPERLILICNTSNRDQLQRMVSRLERPTLPQVELVYMSTRLRDAMGIPGRICPTIVDPARFQPRPKQAESWVVGRLSADKPEKHHPDDASLYRLLAWYGAQVRLMGASCLQPALDQTPRVELLPVGSETPEDFLHTLSVFFYRTREDWHEPSGRVVMEALACGLPIVADSRGGYTDWIEHGKNGFFFSTQEEAWELLQALQGDAAMRHRLAEAARNTAAALSDPRGRHVQEYLTWLRAPS